MATTEKMTYAKAIDYVLTNCTLPAEVAEKFTALSASLAKKSATAHKPTAQQTANEDYKNKVVEFLTENEGKGFTCSDLIHEIPEFATFSNQRVSMLMSALVKENRVEKYVEKRRSYFRIASEVEG